MPIDRDILSRVRRLSAEKADAMTADKLFTSREFLSYAQSVINAVTGRYELKIKLEAYHGELDGDTAATNNRVITVNTHHRRTYFFDSLLNKFLSQMGGILHECSHCLYMNFDIWEKQIQAIRDGRFLETPDTESVEEEETLEQLNAAIQKEEYRPLIASVFHSLYNIFQDGHDEEKMILESVPLIAQCILMRREAKKAEFPAVEDMVQDKNWTQLTQMYALLLEMSLFEDVFMQDPQTAFTLEPMQKLRELVPTIRRAKNTDNAKLRGELTVKTMLFLWPYIEEEVESQKQELQQNSSGNTGNPQTSAGNVSPQQNQADGEELIQQAVQHVLNQLGQCAQMGTTTVPEKGKTSSVAKANQKAAKKQTAAGMQNTGNQQAQQMIQTTSSGTFGTDPGLQALQQLVNTIATADAEEELQDEISGDALIVVQSVNQNSTHRGIPIYYCRRTDVSEDDKKLYNETMAELTGYSKRLQRHMKQALRDLQDGSIAHHRYFGNRFEARSAYRPDQRMYAQKKLPKDLPEMAISILVDHSGSMNSGDRLMASMKASMLLYDFATSLDIPVEVSGHNTASCGQGVNYFQYTDFRQVTPREKYRLAKMRCGGCNRDGAAIEIAANRLARRPEDVKLLIVISDGQPNDTDYGGEEAAKDISSIVKRYRKLGVETIAAAIGDDKERIKEIYGEGVFLDIGWDLSVNVSLLNNEKHPGSL